MINNRKVTDLACVRSEIAHYREYYTRVLTNAAKGDFDPYNSDPPADFHSVYGITFLAILAQEKNLVLNTFFINEKCFSFETCDSIFEAVAHKLKQAPANYCCAVLHYDMTARGHWYLYLIKKKDDGSLFILSCDSTNYDLARAQTPEESNRFITCLETNFAGRYSILKLMQVIGFEKGIQTDLFSCGEMAMDAFKRLNALFVNNPILLLNIDRIEKDSALQEQFKTIFLRNSQRRRYKELQPSCDYRQSQTKGQKILCPVAFWKDDKNLNNIRKLVSWLVKADEFSGTIAQAQWEEVIEKFTLLQSELPTPQQITPKNQSRCALM